MAGPATSAASGGPPTGAIASARLDSARDGPPAEVHGFVGFLVSGLAYGLFIVWAFIPAHVLAGLGIDYYPSKDWAIIVPTWCCVAIVFVFWVYESLNMMTVPLRSSIATVRDEHSKSGEPFPADVAGIPPLVDVPLDVMCRRLYGSESTSA